MQIPKILCLDGHTNFLAIITTLSTSYLNVSRIFTTNWKPNSDMPKLMLNYLILVPRIVSDNFSGFNVS